MNLFSELTESLKISFQWNKSRVNCFAGILLALIAVRTVNLREIAVAFLSEAQLDSRYRRIRRFFASFKIDFVVIARWIFRLYLLDGQKVHLTMDRTNWYWGKSKINVFVLGFTHKGVAIPLLWRALNKAGAASAKEHQDILQRFIDIFGKKIIADVLGDREFASESLFSWLKKENIPFHIRIKDNSKTRLLHESYHDTKLLYYLFKDLKPNEMRAPKDLFDIFGVPLYIAASRSERGELMVVVTNQDPKDAIACYLRRWEIETLFSCLKERGFNFEDTRLTDLERIEKLTAILAMATAWMHKIGEWRATIKPIKFKKFKNGEQRPQYSYFRYGLDYIREAIFQINDRFDWLHACIELLKPKKIISMEVDL